MCNDPCDFVIHRTKNKLKRNAQISMSENAKKRFQSQCLFRFLIAYCLIFQKYEEKMCNCKQKKIAEKFC